LYDINVWSDLTASYAYLNTENIFTSSLAVRAGESFGHVPAKRNNLEKQREPMRRIFGVRRTFLDDSIVWSSRFASAVAARRAAISGDMDPFAAWTRPRWRYE